MVATLGCALAPDIASLLTLRAVEGFGAGAGSVLGRAIIRDLFDGPQMARMLSLALAAFITAPIVAPTIGALILAFASWRWIFGSSRVYGVVMLALAALFLEESLKVTHPTRLRPAPLLRAFAAVFRDPRSRRLGDRRDLGLRHAHHLPHQLLGRADAGLRPEPFRLRRRLRHRRGLLLDRQPAQLTARPAPAAGAPDPLGAAGCRAGRRGWPWVLALTGVGGVWALVVAIGLFFVASAWSPPTARPWPCSRTPHAPVLGCGRSGFRQTVVPAMIGSVVALLYDGTAVPMLATILLLFALCLAIAWYGPSSQAAPAR